MPKRKAAWAAVNIIGPDGQLTAADAPIPEGWDADYVEHLVETGGATFTAPATPAEEG